MTAKPLVVGFRDIDKEALSLVGGKAANLGEMTKAGFPVPVGFSVTVHAYDMFLEKNDLNEKINDILKKVNVDKPDQLQEAEKKIRKIVTRSEISREVSDEVIKAYKDLSSRFKNSYVAVRSSATAEDLPSASFAGQQSTFLNVKGEANLLVSVRKCWASLFTARAIFYREQNKISQEKVKISVVVQKMVQAEASGVLFTIDPVTQEKDRIVIEAVFGLGELVVQGVVVPDRYVVQKETFEIISKQISQQHIKLVKVGQKTRQVDVAKHESELQKISDEDIVKLAKIGDKLQKHYYFPQDVEWVREGKKLLVVQTRPVTTVSPARARRKRVNGEIKNAEGSLLSGLAASPGIGTGPVKIIKSPKELNKVKLGDVLVARMTSPDYVPAMKRAKAIVTDEGGMTSHCAIVSRELGIPCVVGTKEATTKLKDETVVTVDGASGLVFLGSKMKIFSKGQSTSYQEEKVIKTKTATRMYVNLAEPQLARKVSRLNVDGVGLLRAEFMIADIGIHPKEAIKQKKQKSFINKLAKGLEIFCKAFNPRPVVYRATDFKTNEYRLLSGGTAWEPEEPNPMLGYRGAFRYIANPDIFNLELKAIKEVRSSYKNLWLMIPYVRSPAELAAVRRIVAAERFFSDSTFKFWMMVELPVNVISIEDFIKVGIDGVSIGSNDLTMLITGTDRDNQEVAQAFDERAPAVTWALKRTIKACVKHGITSSICGQAPSVYDELVERLVALGITSVSVNPDAANRVRRVIYETENRIAKGKVKN